MTQHHYKLSSKVIIKLKGISFVKSFINGVIAFVIVFIIVYAIAFIIAFHVFVTAFIIVNIFTIVITSVFHVFVLSSNIFILSSNFYTTVFIIVYTIAFNNHPCHTSSPPNPLHHHQFSHHPYIITNGIITAPRTYSHSAHSHHLPTLTFYSNF